MAQTSYTPHYALIKPSDEVLLANGGEFVNVEYHLNYNMDVIDNKIKDINDFARYGNSCIQDIDTNYAIKWRVVQAAACRYKTQVSLYGMFAPIEKHSDLVAASGTANLSDQNFLGKVAVPELQPRWGSGSGGPNDGTIALCFPLYLGRPTVVYAIGSLRVNGVIGISAGTFPGQRIPIDPDSPVQFNVTYDTLRGVL